VTGSRSKTGVDLQLRAETTLPTRKAGAFRLLVYGDAKDSNVLIALVKGQVDTAEPVLVRLHSQCLTGDVFGSERCDCGEQLETALATIEKAGTGVLVYMFDEGRGIGLLNKIRAYVLQDQGQDTVEANHALGFAADMRDYGTGAHILLDLGVRSVRLMTNNPEKVRSLEEYGLKVTERVPIEVVPGDANRGYLETKRDKFGHLLSMGGEGEQVEPTLRSAGTAAKERRKDVESTLPLPEMPKAGKEQKEDLESTQPLPEQPKPRKEQKSSLESTFPLPGKTPKGS
jgi:3,4-dihydroxy 2-butanone 4-phosphate synthase / GTP cyclohydrolase II